MAIVVMGRALRSMVDVHENIGICRYRSSAFKEASKISLSIQDGDQYIATPFNAKFWRRGDSLVVRGGTVDARPRR